MNSFEGVPGIVFPKQEDGTGHKCRKFSKEDSMSTKEAAELFQMHPNAMCAFLNNHNVSRIGEGNLLVWCRSEVEEIFRKREETTPTLSRIPDGFKLIKELSERFKISVDCLRSRAVRNDIPFRIIFLKEPGKKMRKTYILHEEELEKSLEAHPIRVTSLNRHKL